MEMLARYKRGALVGLEQESESAKGAAYQLNVLVELDYRLVGMRLA